MNRCLPRVAACTWIALNASTLVTTPSRAQRESSLTHAMLVTEDGRGSSDTALAPLFQGLQSPRQEEQRLAVRALGRLEQESLLPRISPMLAARFPSVRREAANALAQVAGRGDPSVVGTLLFRRLRVERDPTVIGAIAQSLGRLPYRAASSRREAEWALVEVASADAEPDVLLGAARGLESLLRRAGAGYRPGEATVERLRDLLRHGRTIADTTTQPSAAVRVRRLAIAALTVGRGADLPMLETALGDPDMEVRRLAVRASGMLDSLEGREQIIERGSDDSAAHVRYEALGAYARRIRSLNGCEPIVRAVHDANPHVSLHAIDLLGSTCPKEAGVGDLLNEFAEQLDPGAQVWQRSWHRPAHALVALSSVDAQRAGSLVVRFAEHDNWLVRLYAARAATQVPLLAVLRQLAADRHPNVRHAAITGLLELRGHGADSLYIAALSSPDYQLLIAAASALEGTQQVAAAIPALLGALRRVTLERRETSRDARRALIDRLAELAGPVVSDELRPFVNDFDPAIAEQAAGLLSRWTGHPHAASPSPLPRAPVPTADELDALASALVTIRLSGGGEFTLRLLPNEAPTNAARFARLARTGYLDGLTFHRVVPNFVVQGGSPGANEYAGDGPYTRDELGLRSHLRGTVGLSTRGRDTGDGQLFINLVDNVRLDHNYTIFAVVSSGMQTVDALLEGATIERVIVRVR